MYFITTKRMLEVCFSVHPNIQYRTFFVCPSHGRLLCPDKCVLTAGTASFAMQSAKRDMVYSFSG